MEFPIDETLGKVSTTAVNKAVWISFLKPLLIETDDDNDELDKELLLSSKARKLSNQIKGLPSKEWRHSYIPYVNQMMELLVEARTDVALDMCQSGLKELHSTMLYKSKPLTQVLKDLKRGDTIGESKMKSRIVQGEVPVSSKLQIELPFPSGSSSQESLSGEELKAKLNEWVTYGCMESSASKNAYEMASSLTREHFEDKVFVLLGATSELGPALTLANWGATFVAISRPGTKLDNLMNYVREQTSATMIVPYIDDGDSSGDTDDENKGGVDVLNHVPEIARWIGDEFPKKHVVLCPLIYLDGEANVRAVTAMDAILQHVLEARSSKSSLALRSNKTSFAFWISPGIPHVISYDAAKDALERYNNKVPLWHRAFRLMPSLGGFQRNPISCITSLSSSSSSSSPGGNLLYVHNGLADFQGPNYALSKCVQLWRAMVSSPQYCTNANKDTSAFAISANVSPPTRTQSMIHGHPEVEAWLNGIETFEPMTVFEPTTARTLMTLLMMSDLQHEESNSVSNENKEHPMTITIQNAVHGGCWRVPYSLNSVGAVSYLAGKVKGMSKSE